MRRLLVVDDQEEICDLIAAYFTEQGYTVTTASNGPSAKQALQHETFEALIVDVVLPSISGLVLAEIASSRRIPVLLISGEPTTIDKLDGQSPHLFLQKPFHLCELGNALHGLIENAAPARGRHVRHPAGR